MLRFLIILVIIFSMLNQIFWLAGLLGLYYLARYSTFELVLVAALLDGYYGAFHAVPILTLLTSISWFLAEIIKEGLLMYTEKNETFS